VSGGLAAVRLALVALVAALVLAPTAGAAQTTLLEIEREVMCPVCGTLLELAEAPQAQSQRAFIERRIDAGQSKDEIKDALVVEYGEEVLALPKDEGFTLSAYVVPVVGFALAVLALGIGIWSWRRQGGSAGGRPAPEGPSEADSRRLDEDLERYDL
jgi:cytochrome c-type biogenesis protein CcmH